MSQADIYERYMLELVNAERAAFGLDPLRLELDLNAAAELHSLWMLDQDIFSHTGVGGSSPSQRMVAAGFEFSGYGLAAENIAVQSERGAAGIMDDVQNLHVSLMNSPGHRANILNANAEYIGIGIELGGFRFSSGEFESVIVTQKFAATGGPVRLDPGPEPTAPVAPSGDAGNNALVGTAAADRIEGLDGRDTITGDAGNDSLLGGRGNDTLRGGGDDDQLLGGRGHDRLFGDDGRDVLNGGAGNDTLLGGAGNDKLKGHAGADVFVFRPGDAVDEIVDFVDGIDRINLRAHDFATAAEAMGVATQRGADVVFDFGDGDSLIVRNAIRADLADDLLV